MDAKATKEELISLTGVGVERGGKWLVRGMDVSIARGEIVTLIGPNGSGKSTTAKVATGVLKATEGLVTRKPGLTIGYVPQKLSVDWTLPLTVKRLMTLTGSYADAEIEAALDEVGARHLLRAAVQELSGGEFQRVLFARAMVRKPDLLVLDEPVQGVDFSGEVALYDLIRTIRNRSHAGILMISHDLHVVMADTDTVICLNGHVCCRGTPDLVARSPEYLALFGTRAAETLAIYQHHHDHTHNEDGSIADGHDHSHDGHDHHGHDHHGHDHAHPHRAPAQTHALMNPRFRGDKHAR
jgi:zinc transport system ATP-binding protein